MEPPLGELADDEIDRLWRPWAPAELDAELRHRGCDGLRWAVAGGWAIDLALGRQTREHEDLEMVVLAEDAPVLLAAFGEGWTWRAPYDEVLHPLDDQALRRTHQTWLWSAEREAFVLDVFRNRHAGDTWICHRHEAITAPWGSVIARTPQGISYLTPEVVLLHKAKHRRDKDVADLESTLPTLDADALARLREWLERAHPGHDWLTRLPRLSTASQQAAARQ